MNVVKAKLSRENIINCNKCMNQMKNDHIFQCIWKLQNENDISYEQINKKIHKKIKLNSE